MNLNSFKNNQSQCLDYDSCHKNRFNMINLKEAEINCKVAKQSLIEKSKFYKENNLYCDVQNWMEYIHCLGCKEILKRENAKRKYIKNFIKNMNKKELKNASKD